jgi:hypothetical protein
MRSPSPQPAHGSSKAAGGVLRGNQETHRLADMEDDLYEQAMPLATGLVRLYTTSLNPSDFNPAEKTSTHSQEHDTVSTLAPILKKLQRRFPSISSKSNLLYPYCSIHLPVFCRDNLSQWKRHSDLCLSWVRVDLHGLV